MQIPTWIQEFNSSLYQDIQSKLDNSDLEYKLEKLNTWSELNRELILVDLIHQIFGYISLTSMYELPIEVVLDAYSIFKVSLESVPLTLTQEINSAEEMQGNISNAIKRISIDIVMGHLTPKISVNPKDTLDLMFKDYHYLNVFLGLNVGTLKLPLQFKISI